MVNQKENSMIGGNVKCSPSLVAPDRKQSECEAAYQQLCKSQEDLGDAIADLHSRLDPVLGAEAGEDSNTPGPAPLSEVHGWIVASEERTYALTRRVRRIIASLTI